MDHSQVASLEESWAEDVASFEEQLGRLEEGWEEQVTKRESSALTTYWSESTLSS